MFKTYTGKGRKEGIVNILWNQCCPMFCIKDHMFPKRLGYLYFFTGFAHIGFNYARAKTERVTLVQYLDCASNKLVVIPALEQMP